MSIHTIATVLSRCAERKEDGRTYAGSLVTIDKAHHEVHEGDHYFVSRTTAAASATDVMCLLLTTPATKKMHYTGSFGGSGAIIKSLVENPTLGAVSQAALVEYNSDRSSTKMATLVAKSISSTDISGGTTLEKVVLGGGLQGRTGGSQAEREELILKQSEDYAILIESKAAGNNIAFLGTWYEESS